MAAPIGNQYWTFAEFKGRKKKLTPEEWYNKVVQYMEHMQTQVWVKKEPIKSGEMAGELIDIPTKTPLSIGSLCIHSGIDQNTFYRYLSEKGYEEYWEITTWAKQTIENQQFEGATVGAYNPNIIARTLGLADKQDIKVDANISDLKLPDFIKK
jgi:hypothetical protein